ncbi:MAG: transporter associated domain-containing protein [Undibacterium sp.]|nr:transporter associated domain-containing protein [Undibacterium sp.]
MHAQTHSLGTPITKYARRQRDIHIHLQLNFPLNRPKTLNGLLPEYLQDIPKANISIKFQDCILELIRMQNQSIKVVKLIRNTGETSI